MRVVVAALLLSSLFTLFTPLPATAEVVNFYTWGGSPQVNTYLRWAQKEMRAEQVQLRHNRVADIAEVVKQIIEGSSNADLIWINGENFHALKKANALLPIVDDIQAMQNVNSRLNWQNDSGEPVAGLEVPWGVGQFNLLARSGVFAHKNVSAQGFLEAAKANPGRLSYPKPPDFHGTTFLKSLLLSLHENQPAVFQQSVDAVQAAAITTPLWGFLDQLHPLLWQRGANFPSSAGEQITYLANGQLFMAVSFNPNDYKTLVHDGRLPQGIQRYVLSERAITNTHYLAIPRSAQHPEQAKQVIEFLLSASAQQRKAEITGWGDPAVLTPQLVPGLAEKEQLLAPTDDFHASWQPYLEQQWSARYQ